MALRFLFLCALVLLATSASAGEWTCGASGLKCHDDQACLGCGLDGFSSTVYGCYAHGSTCCNPYFDLPVQICAAGESCYQNPQPRRNECRAAQSAPVTPAMQPKPTRSNPSPVSAIQVPQRPNAVEPPPSPDVNAECTQDKDVDVFAVTSKTLVSPEKYAGATACSVQSLVLRNEKSFLLSISGLKWAPLSKLVFDLEGSLLSDGKPLSEDQLPKSEQEKTQAKVEDAAQQVAKIDSTLRIDDSTFYGWGRFRAGTATRKDGTKVLVNLTTKGVWSMDSLGGCPPMAPGLPPHCLPLDLGEGRVALLERADTLNPFFTLRFVDSYGKVIKTISRAGTLGSVADDGTMFVTSKDGSTTLIRPDGTLEAENLKGSTQGVAYRYSRDGVLAFVTIVPHGPPVVVGTTFYPPVNPPTQEVYFYDRVNRRKRHFESGFNACSPLASGRAICSTAMAQMNGNSRMTTVTNGPIHLLGADGIDVVIGEGIPYPLEDTKGNIYLSTMTLSPLGQVASSAAITYTRSNMVLSKTGKLKAKVDPVGQWVMLLDGTPLLKHDSTVDFYTSDGVRQGTFTLPAAPSSLSLSDFSTFGLPDGDVVIYGTYVIDPKKDRCGQPFAYLLKLNRSKKVGTSVVSVPCDDTDGSLVGHPKPTSSGHLKTGR
jgi:hypothetical protein